MVYILRHSRGYKLPNIKINRPSDKLNVRKIGPYEILEQIGEVDYKLALPDTIKLQIPVFYVSQLEKAQVEENTGRPILDEIIMED
jgi:hypothetical protein